MSPAHVLEPTYQAIRHRLMMGQWLPGFHLDTARLADELGVSKSPVRDSLNHLAGERMVEFEAGVGFHVPRLDETTLQDLLDLNLGLLRAAVGTGPIAPLAVTDAGRFEGAADRFVWLARSSGNAELVAAIGALNDRLAAVRRLAPLVLVDSAATLTALDNALANPADRLRLNEILARYHTEWRRHAGAFVRLLAIGSDIAGGGHGTPG